MRTYTIRLDIKEYFAELIYFTIWRIKKLVDKKEYSTYNIDVDDDVLAWVNQRAIFMFSSKSTYLSFLLTIYLSKITEENEKTK